MKYIFTLLFLTTLSLFAQRAYLVKDINTEINGGANVQNLTEFNGKLVFTAENDMYGEELWETDGTPEGTKLMVDITAGKQGSSPRFLTVLGDKLYFMASDRATGQELWVTDGTPEGTQRITDLNPGPSDSRVDEITVYNGKLYFEATDGSDNANELWVSDGTTEGTKMVKNIDEGINSGSGPNFLTIYNGKLYFSAYERAHNRELWVTDGTEAGTHIVKDINPSMYGSSDVADLVVYNGKLFFYAYDGSQYELWESDGTEAGTKLAVDINPFASSFPRGLTVFNNKLYLRANYGTIGTELFETDGTPAGTKLVKDISPLGGSSPGEFTVFNNKLYFSANNHTEGNELWETDGTETGTQLVKDIYSGTGSSNIQSMVVFNNRLFFGAQTNFNDSQLWSSDGTEASTQQVYQIDQGTSSSNARNFIDYNNQVYFQANDDIHGSELWKTDGTEAGTQMVKDVYPGSRSGTRNMLGVINGKLYFEAADGVHGDELWVTDGTEAGTQMLKDIHPGSGSSDPYTSTVLNGKLYFSANDGTNGEELWVTDGTEIGTQIVKDINPGTNSSYPFEFTTYNNKIYFNARDGVHGTELWESDGTETGTKLVTDIFPGALGSDPRDLTVNNNKLYFRANDGIQGGELWVTDGTVIGTQLVKDIRTGTSWSSPQWMASYRNKLYFRANDGVHGDELWESDGTEAGTKLTVNIKEGRGSGSSVAELVVLQDRLYFRADDGILGAELWVTDGTVEGTRLAADMDPGTSGSDLDDMVVSNGKLFFNADGGKFGEEIWAYEPFDCSILTSTILYVNPEGTATNYGNSWAEATSLQHALQLASECTSIEEIWVQQGTYKPGTNRYDTFSIPSNIKIYGGFKGAETSLTERDWKNNTTILNGDIGIPNSTLGNTYTLLTLINRNNILIDGVILENAFSEFDHDRDNLADTRGGGIYLRNANNNSFVNCVFRNNLALEGGAVYQTSGTNNQFINCLFYGNEGLETNAFVVEEGTASYINCTLVNNTIASGNGILGTKDATITFTNSVLEGNHTLNFNTTGTGSLVTIYSYLKGENPAGTGNIDGTTITDVLFKDIAAEDFTLQGSSPLIDKGNNSDNAESKGLGGKVRIIDGDNDSTKTIDIGAFEFGQAEQAITFDVLAEVTYGDADFDLNATSDSGLAITYMSSDTSVATISGNTVTIIEAGTTTITASQAGNDDFKPAIEVLQDLKVNGREITITADAGQSKVFGNTEPVLTYAITSGSLINSDVLTGVLARTAGENVGLYLINQGTLDNLNYDITFVSNDFEINKADQTITFGTLADVIYGASSFELSASSTSGLPIFYTSSNTSVATVSGTTVTIVGVGETTITASQSGNNNYNAAIPVDQTLKVAPRAVTVTADTDQGKVFGAAEPLLTYGITNGSLIRSDVFTGALERMTGEDVGLYPINQGTLDNPNYAITFVSGDFEIKDIDQEITFNPLGNKTYGDADFDLVGTTDSGLPITYTSSNPAVATISGNTVTILGVGSTIITASQAGNDNINAATNVIRPLRVGRRVIRIIADENQTKLVGESDSVLTYTMIEGNLIAGDVLNGSLSRNSGEAVGLYSIRLGSLSNSNYAITFISRNFEIKPATATVSVSNATYTFNGETKSVNVITDPANLATRITYNGSTSLPINAGTYTVNASITDPNYQGSNVGTLIIEKATQTITFDALAEVTSEIDSFELEATTSAGLDISYYSSDTSVVGISGNIATVIGEGSAIITASQPGNINYNEAVSISQTLQVNSEESLSVSDEVIIEKGAITVYPNPSVDQIRVSGIPKNVKVSIYAFNGVLVKQIDRYAEGTPIQVATLPSGMYLIQCISEQSETTKKFVKK